uniref:CD166 antigen isoform X2 n=1 Tax=Ciona intestinalis TaxID=7719 RepID=UPI000521AA6F|nr:CD166 antigen isoform X2 [Ciona intestinalis]|eukprot:XP_009858240.1 CD166 antigen isoform X2 [Ciona intestinalis]
MMICIRIVLGLFFIAKCSAQITFMLQNVTAEVGSDAVIPCIYETVGLEGMIPTIRWYAQQESSRPRLYVFVQGDEGSTFKGKGITRNLTIGMDGSLIIPQVTLADNDEFSKLVCEVDFASGGQAEGPLTFGVYSFPTTEPVTTSDLTEFESSEEKVIVGSCESGSGYPEPVITFYKGDEKVNEGEANDFLNVFNSGIIKTSETDGTTSVKKTLSIPLSKADDNMQFYCVVTTTMGSESKMQNATMPLFRVKYPTDEVTVTSDSNMIEIGDTIMLTCEGNGYPEPSITSFNEGTSSTISVTVTKEDNNRVIECTATNPTSVPVTGSYTINVNYLDTPMITGSEIVKLGAAFELSCASSGNPQVSSIMWKKNGQDYSQSNPINVASAAFSDQGLYQCVATNGDKTATQEIEVTVNGLSVNNEEKIFESIDSGNTAEMVCVAEANPAPSFVWARVGSEEEGMHDIGLNLQIQNPFILIVTEAILTQNGMTYTSTLTVGPLDKTFSNVKYTCTVSADGETVEKSFVLPEIETDKPEKEILDKSGSPTAGIIIGILVALLVVAIIIAVLYNKGIICNKGEKGDENAEDIAVEINKDDAANDDVEAARKPEDAAEPEEDTRLVNGNGDQ